MNLLRITPAFLLTVLLGCSPNTSNPGDVARSFIEDLGAKKYEQAIEHVVPEDRKDFLAATKDLEQFPPLPDNPEVLVEIDGQQGHLTVTNWDAPVVIDLIYKDNRWWIRK